jgi:hypothetical protein
MARVGHSAKEMEPAFASSSLSPPSHHLYESSLRAIKSARKRAWKKDPKTRGQDPWTQEEETRKGKEKDQRRGVSPNSATDRRAPEADNWQSHTDFEFQFSVGQALCSPAPRFSSSSFERRGEERKNITKTAAEASWAFSQPLINHT